MQGYITIALGPQKYVDMAVNLAKSIRFFDPTRPICLIHDAHVILSDADRGVFDDLRLLTADPAYVGVANKIRIYDVSPYDETMYIDADCLLGRGDIDRHWQKAAKHYFTMTGEKAVSGTWNDLDIANICQNFSIPYVVRMNSGVLYFKKSTETAAFFAKVNWLYHNHRTTISNIHQSRTNQYADEPLFGVAMGMFGLSPVEGSAAEGSWMVTTWRARRCRVDLATGEWSLEKPKGYWFGIPLPILARGWIKHTPTIYHFIKAEARLRTCCSIFFGSLYHGPVAPRTAPPSRFLKWVQCCSVPCRYVMSTD